MKKPLKILLVNWAWHRVAGEWTYVDNLRSLYQRFGHHVIPFSMKSPKNEDTGGYEKYFVNHINYIELSKNKNIVNGVRAVAKSIYSLEAKRKLQALLEDNLIDAVHIHDINHYITPSILPVLKQHKIPVLFTLHDYLLICPEATLYSNGSICENCKGGAFYHCATQKCKKKSFLASTLAAAETTVHHATRIFRHVDYFLCPSQFLFDKYKAFGFFPDKLVLSNLCCEVNTGGIIDAQKKKYIIFSGRLVTIKGIYTLLQAVQGLNVQLYIAGEGPEEENIKTFIATHGIINVVLLGFKSKEEIHLLVQNALLLICPSQWYENFPYTVIEAMLVKTPVVASRIGGIPELVIHQETGFLFEPSDHSDLREKIIYLLQNEGLRNMLADNAYKRTRSIVSYENHHQVLKQIFLKTGLDL